MTAPSQILFLPGASARTEFWQPVSNLLTHPANKVLMSWPGFGPVPPDPEINGIGDLVTRVVSEIDQPTALVAQSMGGVVAILAALERPELVTHLVLCVTSGGIDTLALGAQDWRPDMLQANPSYPHWFVDYKTDLSPRLAAITVPVLLLWGDADPISPLAVGIRLFELLPRSDLHVIPGGHHDLAYTHATIVAPLIDRHLDT
ncbi:alpha/beta fold hydrolase [Ferrigenium kumadai]|nr:alpha/beta fold hydrolase [Ferrigenium kumadai]